MELHVSSTVFTEIPSVHLLLPELRRLWFLVLTYVIAQ